MASRDGEDQLLLDFIGELYEAASEPALWRKLAPKLAHLFGSASCMLLTANTRGSGSTILGVTENVGRRFLGDYESYYYTQDQWILGGLEHPGRVILGHEVAPPEWYRNFEFFNELCVRAGIYRLIGSAIPLDGNQFGVVGIHRSQEAPEFDRADVSRLETLLPHIRRAMQLTLRLNGARIDHQAALDGLERTGTAVIVVDRGGTILFANSLAALLLRQGGSLRSVGGRLVGVERRVEVRLARLIDEATRTAVALAGGGAVAIAREDGRPPVTVLVAPFRPALPPCFGAPAATALVFVRDPETPTMAQDILKDLFGLTSAQAAVAARVAAGEDLEHIAVTMRISLYTVRDHLKVIFAKTGTMRQPQLVALLAPTVAALGSVSQGAASESTGRKLAGGKAR